MKTGLKIAAVFVTALVLGVGGLSLLLFTDRRSATQQIQPQPAADESVPQPSEAVSRPPQNPKDNERWRREQANKFLKDMQERAHRESQQRPREFTVSDEELARMQERIDQDEKLQETLRERGREFRKRVKEDERRRQREIDRSRPPSYWR